MGSLSLPVINFRIISRLTEPLLPAAWETKNNKCWFQYYVTQGWLQVFLMTHFQIRYGLFPVSCLPSGRFGVWRWWGGIIGPTQTRIAKEVNNLSNLFEFRPHFTPKDTCKHGRQTHHIDICSKQGQVNHFTQDKLNLRDRPFPLTPGINRFRLVSKNLQELEFVVWTWQGNNTFEDETQG